MTLQSCPVSRLVWVFHLFDCMHTDQHTTWLNHVECDSKSQILKESWFNRAMSYINHVHQIP